MPDFKPESLDWLDDLSALGAEQQKDPSAKTSKLADALDSHKSMISFLLAIQACLDPAAIENIRLASQRTPSFTLSFNSARALSRLNKRVKAEDLSSQVHTALEVILARRLATKDIKKLVAWMVNGNPAETFDPKQKAVKPPRHQGHQEKQNLSGEGETDDPSTGKTNSLDLKKHRQLLEKAEAERIQGKETIAQEKLKAHILEIAESLTKSKSNSSPVSDKVLSETIFLDWLADVPVLARIKAKRKKGKSLTTGELSLLVLHKAGELLGHLVKIILKLFKPIFKPIHLILKLVVEALKELGLYKYAKAIFTLVVVIAGIWFAWEAFHYGIMRPVEMIWSKIHREQTVEESPTPVPTPQVSNLLSLANTAMTHLKSKPTPIPTPSITYRPAILFTAASYDPRLLEQEISAVPSNSLIKAYPLEPDETMPGDLAVSRLQDLTDVDKYTMKLGHETEKILSVNATTTNFIVNYKSGDAIGGFLSGSGQMNFFWEDVKYIHSDEIDIETKNPSVIYQCSLIVSGSKDALTIQCASIDDLNHLVSTMEYFIRSSRLGHDAQPAGLPYPTQGLRFNGIENVINLLWAGSPAALAVSPMETAQPNLAAQPGASQQVKAGLELGDHLWSVG